MRRFLPIQIKPLRQIMVFGVLSLCCLSAMALPVSRQQFINKIRTAVRQVNQEVLKQRHRIEQDQQTLTQNHSLSESEQQWLSQTANSYKLSQFSLDDPDQWQELLKRVNVIPESLTIAQAIDESAWGQSRFAREANNYFGRWCYVKGCGILPKKRSKGAHHEIKSFASAYESIRDYVHNLNSNSAYRHLRDMRAAMHAKKQPLNGVLLAGGLLRYSSRGQAYVHDIQGIISKFQLQAKSADNLQSSIHS